MRSLQVVTVLGSLAVLGALVGSEPACNKAQTTTAVQDVPTDIAAVLCVVTEALGGASIPVIAATCSVSEEAIASEIATLIAEGHSGDAGASAQMIAAKLEATPAMAAIKAARGKR